MTNLRWRRPLAYAALLVAWATLAFWQYREYRHECALAQQILHRQAHALMNALVGGIRSHRRLGRFFEEQLQGVLDELVKSEDVLAVAVHFPNEAARLVAGQTNELPHAAPLESGDTWRDGGFELVEHFVLSAEPHGLDATERPGAVPGRGPGWRRGGVAGYGRGRGPGAQLESAQAAWMAGGRFAAVLVLDNDQADAQCRRAAWSRTTVAAAGALVLLAVALAWRATVRLAEARGRQRVLQAEAHHLRELSQAAAGLAHETRNPLGLIRGWTQRLAEDRDHDQREQHAQAVIEECDRVTSRINQFLAFARPCQPTLDAVVLPALLDEVSMLLQPDLQARQLKIRVEGAERVGTIQADRELLRQALFNLMQNAIQFSPPGQTVDVVATSGENGGWRLDVADRGPGVDQEAVASLFSPYFTTRPDGTGLGLAIVRRIALAHGWTVGYIARAGGGSVFRLETS